MRRLAAVLTALLFMGDAFAAAGGDGDGEDNSGPLTAGRKSAEAAQAERVYKSERWADAAVILDRVTRGAAGDDDESRQRAAYDLGIALYRLKLYQASFNVFGAIAEPQNHLRHRDALYWLADLADVLPDVDDVVEELGTYSAQDVARAGLSTDPRRASTLYYLLGRRAFQRRAYEEAVSLFDKVDPKSDRYLSAQIFAGTASVVNKLAVPAVKRFFRAIEAADEGTARFKDGAALRDLALMSMARVYYTAAFAGIDAGTDPRRMSASIKYWAKVNPDGGAYTESLLEQSWAYFMAGDYGHALGNVHTIESPFFPKDLHPEASALKAIIAFTVCHYEDTVTLVARLGNASMPARRELVTAISSIEAAGGEARLFAALVSAKEQGRPPPADLRPAVELAMSDGFIARKLAKVRFLEAEKARVLSMPLSFQRSLLGQDILKALGTAQEIASLRASERARALCERRIAEIDKSMDDGRKLLIDVRNAQIALLNEPIRNDYRLARPVPTMDGFKDVEHVVWPFDGEYWRDELGSYRQLVISRCDR